MIKALSKLCIEGSYLSIPKDIYVKPIANIALNREKLKAFPLRSERKRYLLPMLLFNIVLEILIRELNMGKEIDMNRKLGSQIIPARYDCIRRKIWDYPKTIRADKSNKLAVYKISI
jgi:hypothetical protein